MDFFLFFPDKQLHTSKLFVGDTEDPDLSGWREKAFYPFDMYFCILPAGTMT